MTCKTQIHLYDLLPILSYIILRGKCRHCKSKISPIYMLGEAGTALAYIALYIKYGLSPEFLIGIVMASFIIICIVTDIKERLILDKFTFPAMAVLLLLELVFHPSHVYLGLIGMASIFALLMILNFIKKDGMGGGDIKMLMFIAVVLGPGYTFLTLFAASLLGLLVWTPLRMIKMVDNTLPFGPFIGVAAIGIYVMKDTAFLTQFLPSIG